MAPVSRQITLKNMELYKGNVIKYLKQKTEVVLVGVVLKLQ